MHKITVDNTNISYCQYYDGYVTTISIVVIYYAIIMVRDLFYMAVK